VPSHTLFAVDASTSWGIGVVFQDQWEAWRLDNSWKSQGQDISSAEIVAIELGLHLVLELGHKETHFVLQSDNMGVIHAFRGGSSCNAQQNHVLQCIVALMRAHDV
jgi:hypothetical protein